MDLGEYIKYQRKQKGIKQSHLEKRLDMNPGLLYHYEAGRASTKNLSYKQLRALSKELGVEFLYLCALEPAHLPPEIALLVIECPDFIETIKALVRES